jgi:hypothetical protein
MSVTKFEHHTHLAVLKECYEILFDVSKHFGPKDLSNQELIDIILEKDMITKHASKNEGNLIKELLNLSVKEQKDYLQQYIFSDKEYTI